MATINIQSFPGDVTVTSNLTVDTNTLHVDSVSNRVGIGSTLPQTKLDVGQRCRIYSNLTVSDTFHVDTHENKIGIGTTLPSEALTIKPDTTAKARFGNLLISSGGYSDNAAISAVDQSSAGKYAILQEPPGSDDTFINCVSGRSIIFRDGNLSTSQSVFKGGKFGIGIGANTPTHELEVNGGIYQPSFQWGQFKGPNDFDADETLRITQTQDNNGVYKNNDKIIVPQSGLYHIFGTTSIMSRTASKYDRGSSFALHRIRSGSDTRISWALLNIENISDFTYRQVTHDNIVEANANDQYYFRILCGSNMTGNDVVASFATNVNVRFITKL
jgi:hypothetical protein